METAALPTELHSCNKQFITISAENKVYRSIKPNTHYTIRAIVGLYRIIVPDMGIPEEIIDDEFLEETKDGIRVSSLKASEI